MVHFDRRDPSFIVCMHFSSLRCSIRHRLVFNRFTYLIFKWDRFSKTWSNLSLKLLRSVDTRDHLCTRKSLFRNQKKEIASTIVDRMNVWCLHQVWSKVSYIAPVKLIATDFSGWRRQIKIKTRHKKSRKNKCNEMKTRIRHWQISRQVYILSVLKFLQLSGARTRSRLEHIFFLIK